MALAKRLETMNASVDLSSEGSTVLIADEIQHLTIDCVAYGNDISHSKYPSDLIFSISDDEMDLITDSLLWDIPAPNFNPAHDVGRNYDTIRRPLNHPLTAPPPKPLKRKQR